ncbi:hypothetical protein M5D96_007249 [Drosophila gunungcola]|uniref:Uncharacterized protein n=1 Tax=Drosophila gunungcola TaxID=103775 RepID=A0A9P9YN85_9MUSC|nr:hypothetical protein M5D96_007249 [Drosophila gunungcola]
MPYGSGHVVVIWNRDWGLGWREMSNGGSNSNSNSNCNWRPHALGTNEMEENCHVRREQVQNGAAGTCLRASGAESENGNRGLGIGDRGSGTGGMGIQHRCTPLHSTQASGQSGAGIGKCEFCPLALDLACALARLVDLEIETSIAILIRNFQVEFNYDASRPYKTFFFMEPAITFRFKFTNIDP